MPLLILQESTILRWFVNSTEETGWQDTAMNWLFAGLVISVIVTGVMLVAKWFKKKAARNIIQKTWSGRRTAGLIVIGLLPIVLTLMGVWYGTRNFYNYVGVGGFLRGNVFFLVFFVFFMVTGDFLNSQRRHDLI